MSQQPQQQPKHQRRSWSEAERNLLKQLYNTPATVAQIGQQLGRSTSAVAGQARWLGITTPAHIIRQRANCWTEDASAALREQYPNAISNAELAQRFGRTVRAVTDKARLLRLYKTPETLAAIRHNQSARKAGTPPIDALPIGSLRTLSNGTLEQKYSHATGDRQQRWRAVHHIVWEQAHGAIPAGHVVRFRKGQRTAVLEEITIERLELVSRAENLHRNHPRSYSPALARLIPIKSAITRQVNRISREHAARTSR